MKSMLYSIWNMENSFDAFYTLETDEKYLLGDLLKIGDNYFIIVDKKGNGNKITSNVEYLGNLFSSQTIQFQKFFFKYWYSYFFKTVRLFISDTKYLYRYKLPVIKREKKINLDSVYISKYENYDTYTGYLKMGDESIKTISYDYFKRFSLDKGQNLFVFPDMWTLNCFAEKADFKYDIINSTATSLSKYKSFLAIKEGKTKNILTTHSGIFQDWKNLKNIYIFEPYKWYYKNQQNPRYNTLEVLKQIKFFYDVDNLSIVL